MRDLGIESYRFSIAWPRVLPEGRVRVNRAGVNFYSRMVDTLHEHGIRPFATLYHWDLPAALDDAGGWAHTDAPSWFSDYARLMFRELGDRVPMWCTINEPWVVMEMGYVLGVHPPARQNWAEAAAVSHNLLRAHGDAVAAYRADSTGQIGLVVNLVPIAPASDSEADRRAARWMDAYLNRQFLDPALLGEFPPELPQMFGADWPVMTAEEPHRICAPIDFIGINYYLRLVVADDPCGGPPQAAIVESPNCPRTALGWEIYPQGLTETLLWVRERYGDLPLYITENGAAFADVVEPNGSINDTSRVQYLKQHLRAAGDAIQAGVNLRGYYLWSLLDNFEWQHGFSQRFGIVHVDYPTQRRTPKASARYYADVIRSRGAVLEG
jgi:beta-glucosidase